MEQNISKIKQRILQHLDKDGISKRKFYLRTGVANGVLDKNTGLTEDNIEKYISTYPEINPEWLLTGKGSMYRTIQRSTEPYLAAEEIAEYNAGNHKKKDNPYLIPLVSTEVAAGFGSAGFSITKEDIQGSYLVPDFNGIDFMIRVKGNSMYPKYSSGDIIACRKITDNTFIQWNKCHVIATREQGLIVKRLKKSSATDNITAVSDNPEYEPFDVPKAEITGIALVVGVIRLE